MMQEGPGDVRLQLKTCLPKTHGANVLNPVVRQAPSRFVEARRCALLS